MSLAESHESDLFFVSCLPPKLCWTETRTVRRHNRARPSGENQAITAHVSLWLFKWQCAGGEGGKGIWPSYLEVTACCFPENSHTICQEAEWYKADEKMSPFIVSFWNLVAIQFIYISSFVRLLDVHRRKKGRKTIGLAPCKLSFSLPPSLAI